jgi:uncharacterized membrane protein
MTTFLVGLGLFFATHSLPMAPKWRTRLQSLASAPAYRLILSLLSAVGLVLIVIGFGRVRWDPGVNPALWTLPPWLRHVTMLLMLPAFILLVAAYVPSRLRTATKHPMLAGIMLWAVAHLLVNGDLAAILLFGGFLLWAVADRVAVAQRASAPPPPGGVAGDVTAVAGGVALYLFMLAWGHAWLIGVPLLS